MLNPEALLPFFPAYCDAVFKWDVTHQPELQQTFLAVSDNQVSIRILSLTVIAQVFTMFRNAMGDKWASTIATFPPQYQAKMREVYGL